jgi:hypothetical protein
MHGVTLKLGKNPAIWYQLIHGILQVGKSQLKNNHLNDITAFLVTAGQEYIPTTHMVSFPPGPIFSQEILLNILLGAWNAATCRIALYMKHQIQIQEKKGK